MKGNFSLFFIFFFMLGYGQSNERFIRDSINEIIKERYIFEVNGKFGLKDSLGNKKTLPEFDDFSIRDKYFSVRKDTLWGIYGRDGANIIPVSYNSIENDFPNLNYEEPEIKMLQNFWYGYKYSSKIDDEVFGIYSKSGEQKFPDKISYNRGIYESGNNIYAIVSVIDDENFTYHNDKKINAYKDVLIKFSPDKIIEYPLPFEYKHLEFVKINGKKIVAYTSANNLYGFYDVQTNKTIKPEYKGYIFNEKKIFAKKNNYYSTEIDENLNINEKKEQIISVLKEYAIIQDKENMRVLKGDKKSKFSFPLILFKEIKDKDIPVLFTYYNDLDQSQKKYSEPGIISFDEKIYIKPSKTGYTSFYQIDENHNRLNQIEDENRNSRFKVFLVKDWRSISPKSDSIEISWYNKEGDLIMHFDKTLYDKYFRYCIQGGLTIKDNVLFGNCYVHPNSYFFVYNLLSKKFIFKDEKAVFSSRNEGGFRMSRFDTELQQYVNTYYTNKLKFLYKENTPKAFKDSDINESKVAVYHDKNNKAGLADFDGKIILKADKIDEIKIIEGNKYENEKNIFIFRENGKIGAMDSDFQKIIPPNYQSLDFKRSCHCFIAKNNNLYGMISSDNVVLLPFRYPVPINNESWSSQFEIKWGYTLFYKYFDNWWKNIDGYQFLLDKEGKVLKKEKANQ